MPTSADLRLDLESFQVSAGRWSNHRGLGKTQLLRAAFCPPARSVSSRTHTSQPFTIQREQYEGTQIIASDLRMSLRGSDLTLDEGSGWAARRRIDHMCALRHGLRPSSPMTPMKYVDVGYITRLISTMSSSRSDIICHLLHQQQWRLFMLVP
jgi:hypothetical protein